MATASTARLSAKKYTTPPSHLPAGRPHHHHHHLRPVSGHKRTHSSAAAAKGSSSSSSLVKSGQGQQQRQAKDDGEEDTMATSFLQFCASCEKQIITPCNNILYCSERCRRSDQKSSYISHEYSPPPTPYAHHLDDQSNLPAPKEPVPARPPTAAPLSNRSSMVMSDEEEEDDNNEEDTTNYLYTSSARTPLSRENSEAARYLRQFQSTNPAWHDYTTTPTTARPPFSTRAFSSITTTTTTTTTTPTTPSLSHTPASTASFSLPYPYTPAAASRSSSYNYNYNYNSTRPLPRRHAPSSSSSYFAASSARSVDLVTPCTTFSFPTATTGGAGGAGAGAGGAGCGPASLQRLYAFKTKPAEAHMTVGVVVEGDLLRYEKVGVVPGTPTAPGSLGRLLGGREGA